MARLFSFLTILLGVCQHVAAQTNDTAAFVVPANFAAGRTVAMRPVYQVGSSLDVKWETTQTSYRIVLYHIVNTTSYQSRTGNTVYSKFRDTLRNHLTSPGKATANKEAGGFSWNIDLQSFTLQPNVFFLAFQPIDGTALLNETSYTQYFNLTMDAVTTTSAVTSTLSTSTRGATTANPTPAEATGSGSAAASASSSAAAAPSSSGLSSGASIGLGVGLGIGAAAALVGAFFFWRRRQKQKRTSMATEAAPPYAAGGAYQDTAQTPYNGMDAKPAMTTYGSPTNNHGYADASNTSGYGVPTATSELPSSLPPMGQHPSPPVTGYTAYSPSAAPTEMEAPGSNIGGRGVDPTVSNFSGSEMEAPPSNFSGSDTASNARFGGSQHPIYEMPGNSR